MKVTQELPFITRFIQVADSLIISGLPEARVVSIHFAIITAFDILLLSLAEEEYDLNDMNAMVPSIAKITITTMSSTSVNH